MELESLLLVFWLSNYMASWYSRLRYRFLPILAILVVDSNVGDTYEPQNTLIYSHTPLSFCPTLTYIQQGVSFS